MTAEITVIPCLKDNYAYLVKTPNSCAVVDPSEAPPVEAALAARGWRLTHILNTHHHGDHTGGNLALKQRFGAKVVGPAKDAARIPGLDIGVDEASGWRLGDLPVEVLEVPGHTRGAVTYLMAGNAFTGDTLFSLGCGRLFEGDPETMHASLQKLARLPDATRIYCGHEYTLNNGRFALILEPDNVALQARFREAERARQMGRPSLPSTMGGEKQTNPFLRTASPAIRKTLGMEKEDQVSVFAEIRRRKDNF
jgi:hydroxyacylglutathione hydrolase